MRTSSLLWIIVIAWLLIIIEAYLFFNLIIPFAPPIHSLGIHTALALLKIVLTFGLGFLWFVVIVSLSETYVMSKLGSRPPTSSS